MDIEKLEEAYTCVVLSVGYSDTGLSFQINSDYLDDLFITEDPFVAIAIFNQVCKEIEADIIESCGTFGVGIEDIEDPWAGSPGGEKIQKKTYYYKDNA